jgi:hypothetical protein
MVAEKQHSPTIIRTLRRYCLDDKNPRLVQRGFCRARVAVSGMEHGPSLDREIVEWDTL